MSIVPSVARQLRSIKVGGAKGVPLAAGLGLGAGVALWLVVSRMFPALGSLARGAT